MVRRRRGARGLHRAAVVAIAWVAAATAAQAGTPAAWAAPPPARVWVVLVPGLGTADVLSGALPTVHRLGEAGAAGVANVSTAGASGAADGAATLGAGARVRAPEEGGLGLAAGEAWRGEAAARLYERWVGAPFPSEGAALVNLGAWEAANDDLAYPFRLGRLGDAIHAAGWRTAVWGDADLPGERRQRDGVLLAMDSLGRVDLAWVGEAARRPDAGAPFGTTLDIAALERRLARLPSDVALVAVEAGDLARWEAEAPDATGARRAAGRERALKAVDAAVAAVWRLAGPRDMVWVVAPSPPEAERAAGQRLAPLAVEAPGWHGALWSPGTRTAGLVTNLDFVPTVLAFLGLPQDPTLVGRPMEARPAASSAWTAAGQLEAAAWAGAQRRPLMIRAYILGAMAVSLVTAAALLWPAARRLRASVPPWSLAVACGPLAMLVLRWAPLAAPVPALLFWAATLAALTAALWRLGRRQAVASFAWAGALTVAAVLLDLFTGGRAMAASPLGFNPIGGARYYGLGNEYMGVVLGAAVLSGAAWLEGLRPGRARRVAVLLAWCAVVAAVGLPQAGANFGGLLTGLGGVAFVALRLLGVRAAPRTVLWTAAAAVAAALAVVWWDAHAGVQAASHVGRAVAAVRAGGWTVLGDIVQRKAEMNLRLFRYTVWSRGLVVSLALYLWFAFRPPAPVADVLRRHPQLAAGLAGVAVLSVLALVLNDSGVVAAATASVWAAAPLLALLAAHAASIDRTSHSGRALRATAEPATLPEDSSRRNP
ncbi:MAG: hypothetical protein IMW98_01030 [Firmicutes bacterium]|nr:hypothetical protein [Bacillota bacterium]